MNSNEKEILLNLRPGKNILEIEFPSRSIVEEAKLSFSSTGTDFPLNISILDSNDRVLYRHDGYFGLINRFEDDDVIEGNRVRDFYITLPVESKLIDFYLWCRFSFPVEFNKSVVYLNFTGYDSVEGYTLFALDRDSLIQVNNKKKYDYPIAYVAYDKSINLVYLGLYESGRVLYIYGNLSFDKPILKYIYENLVLSDLNHDGIKELVLTKSNETLIINPTENFSSYRLPLVGLLASTRNSVFVYCQNNGTLYEIEYRENQYNTKFVEKFHINQQIVNIFVSEDKSLIYMVHPLGIILFDTQTHSLIEKDLGFLVWDLKFIESRDKKYCVVGCSDRTIRIYDTYLENLIYSYEVNYPQEYPLSNIEVLDFDLDGNKDILYTQRAGIMLLKGSGNISEWGPVSRVFFEPSIVEVIRGLFIEDLDEDGDYDIIVGYPSGNLYVISNNVRISKIKISANISKLQEIVDKIGSQLNTKYIKLPMRFYTNVDSRFYLENLRVQYNKTINIEYAYPPNPINIKIHVENLSKIFCKIVVNYACCPPQLIREIPDLSVQEDSMLKIELDRFFWNNDYTYFWMKFNNPNMSFYAINNTLYVVPAKDFFGNVSALIIATDTEGFMTLSNVFNITVLEVNDPPEICPLEEIRIRANTTNFLKLEVRDVDSRQLNINVSDNENITVLPNNTLMLRYTSQGSYKVVVYVSDGEYTNSTTLDIRVYPFSSPMWIRAIPPIVTYKNIPITEDNSPVNLREYVEDPDTDFSELSFIIESSESPVNVTVSREGYLLVYPSYNYIGKLHFNLTVSDGMHNDTTKIEIVVKYRNYPPIYLGGLSKEYIVLEDSSWIVDLSKHFDDIESSPKGLIYRASAEEIIINGTYAVWTPKHGSRSLYNIVFYAIDNESEVASSEPINLIYVEINDPPIYLNNMNDFVVEEGTILLIDLSLYFCDEESQNLIFKCNDDRISIENHTAKYYAAETIKGVIFYAVDPEDNSLYAKSNPINITVISKNKPPKAFIDEVKVAENCVILRGHGYDTDGKVVRYEWKSSIDGIVGDKDVCMVRLSPGKHVIYFRVMDDYGSWSETESVELFVPQITYSRALMLVGTGLIILGSILVLSYNIFIWRLKR